jgi:hypothetical protein
MEFGQWGARAAAIAATHRRIEEALRRITPSFAAQATIEP